jgi:hypothetical protein
MDGVKSLKIIVILKYLNHISGVILWQRQFEEKMKVTIDLKINCLSYILISGPLSTISIFLKNTSLKINVSFDNSSLIRNILIQKDR